ncbi:MAG: VOC family protein [Bacteroidota bacterium]
MASVSIYLNFMGNCEEAFDFYKKVFQSEFTTPIMRMRDIPDSNFVNTLSESDKNKVMHVALPIVGGTLLMGTDMLESMGHQLIQGNNITINLNLDSREQADKLYQKLSEGGSDCVAPHDEFWGYWGVCKDKFGIRWMFNVAKSV